MKRLCNKHYKFEQHMMKEIIDVQEKMIMYEKLDVYDENRNKKGKIIERKEGEILSSDEYILAIQCWIINSNNEILLTKRKATKKNGNMWEPTGGLVQSGENSMDGAKRELKEEIGISVDDNDLILLKTNTEKGNVNVFRNIYVINKDIQINDLEFIDGEVSDAKYVTFEEFKNMVDKGEAFKWLEQFYENQKTIFELQQQNKQDLDNNQFLQKIQKYSRQKSENIVKFKINKRQITMQTMSPNKKYLL